MLYSITQANADLAAVLHGTNLNKVQNLSGLHNRTARQLLGDIDPQETIRKVTTASPIFSQVWDYACPADLKGNRIIDIAPPYYRTPYQVDGQMYNQDFDVAKNLFNPPSAFTVQFNGGVKTIRINDTSLPNGVVLDTCNAVNTWTAGGTASTLAVNNTNFASGSGSLSFNATTGTGYISETLPATTDLTSNLNQSTFFYYLYLPTGSQLTSTELRIGSSSSNYYSIVSSTQFGGNAFQTGWNLIAANWLGATVVGSPVVTAINYIYVGVTVAANQTGICVDNIVSTLGLYRQLEYYSKYMYRDATTGAFQETVTDNSNLINLDTESYNLYLNLLAFYATQQVQGLSAMFFDSNFFGQEYQKGKTRYTALNKSQVTKPRTSYYTQQKGGYGKYVGRKFYL